MPGALAGLWAPLYDEIVRLHVRWKIFGQLYGTSPERIELLNKSAPVLFYILQNVLTDEILLTLSKLADASSTMRNRNLTLETLLHEVESAGAKQTADELRRDLETFRKMCAGVRRRRDKYIAHFDRPTLVEGYAKEVPGPSRKSVTDALAVVARFMNRIEAHFCDTTTGFDDVIFNHGDADVLAATLRRGLRYTQLVSEGVIATDDIDEAHCGLGETSEGDQAQPRPTSTPT